VLAKNAVWRTDAENMAFIDPVSAPAISLLCALRQLRECQVGMPHPALPRAVMLEDPTPPPPIRWHGVSAGERWLFATNQDAF